MIKLPEPAYNGVAHSVETGDTPSTMQRTTVIVEGLPSYSADQLKQAIRDVLEEAAEEFDRRAKPMSGWYEPEEPAEIIRKLKEDIQ